MVFKTVTVRVLLSIALIAGCVSLSSCRGNDPELLTNLGKIPIQHEGRIKSFDVFARETVQMVSGRQTWQKKPAIFFIIDNLSHPESFLDIACIRLDYLELKGVLGLPQEEKYFSYNQLKPSFPAVISLIQSAKDKRDRDERPTKLGQKAEILYSRLLTIDRLVAGDLIKVIPVAGKEVWETPYQSRQPLAGRFREIIDLYTRGSHEKTIAAVSKWIQEIEQLTDEPFQRTVYLEAFYYRINPFYAACWLYLLSFILLIFFAGSIVGRSVGSLASILGFLFHTAGLFLRMLILLRPPVSNMYESMIFMNWILMVCAGIYFLLRKKYFVLTAGALVSALVMIYAHLLPIDQNLDVLVPVLRSNYWLTIHVLTVVSSYGIFGLAMALGHRHLFLDTRGKLSAEGRAVSSHMIYRLIQAGVLALGIGTVLGGVWANESWGRFWGWDPKETWALITFLGYLVVVHLKSAGRINDFGLAISGVLGFLLVLMTWYGVNFLLGRGLHSYGSGSGGTRWIVYFLTFEVLFLMVVFFKRLKKAA